MSTGGKASRAGGVACRGATSRRTPPRSIRVALYPEARVSTVKESAMRSSSYLVRFGWIFVVILTVMLIGWLGLSFG